MQLLADEGVDGPIVEALRQAGYEVAYVVEMTPGISDEDVLAAANRSGALLLTADKDFGELIFRQRLVHAGVMLLRLAGHSPAEKAEIVLRVFEGHHAEVAGAFTVVTPQRLRIRRAI